MRHIKSILATGLLALSLTTVAQTTLSGLDPKRFESVIDGQQTELYTLTNARGMEACITNYGARLVSLMVPNWNGRMEDVVLGFDNIDDYHNIKQNFGATVGRYVGRITGPQFKLDGQVYQLQDDGRGHISHGGTPGFQDRVWNVIIKEKSRVVMQYTSPDGENGFPGNLTVTLTYTLTDQNALDVDFKASTDKPTVLNLTNHSFFNICGDLTRQVLTQDLWIDSKRIATYDQRKNLNGKFRKVKHTPFDFTEPRQIGTRIHRDDEQLNITDGYDHSFILRHPGNQRKPAAVLYDAQSGRTLTVYTTEPAIHVYTANGLKGKMMGKGGIAYGKQTAVCLETMHLSDSPNRSNFPSTVLRPGQTFHSKTVFRFSTDTKVLMKEK